jgi:hypothetical protein
MRLVVTIIGIDFVAISGGLCKEKKLIKMELKILFQPSSSIMLIAQSSRLYFTRASVRGFMLPWSDALKLEPF